MTSHNKTILVLGATGQQGGAAAEQLLADGWKVRAFTRDTSGQRALALAQAGAELAAGDMGDRASLDAAMQGIYGVFSVQPVEWDLSAAAEEIRLGTNVAEAAQAAGVRHFVYSSMGHADKQSLFRKVAKWEVEKIIESLGLPATVFRPPYFMENYVNFPHYGIRNGTYLEAINPDIPVPMIAVEDIGKFAALAFQHPERYLGKTIELAGDAKTPPDIAAAISRVSGKTVVYTHIPSETVHEQSEIMGKIYDWLNAGNYVVDIPSLRKLHPGLLSFDAWLEKNKAKVDALFARP
ncbi:NmrA/HSCARG family protein [Paenibacillus hamazuiensis]|uniref:NmrA/HSCARG family protein n=1 Tax=Paenibacillus hamazuiensis TaxID=2936508 RepID=UPI00200DE26F|nr:NmrA/HSCARG family protein [Paenibacillus hamazuiensis]